MEILFIIDSVVKNLMIPVLVQQAAIVSIPILQRARRSQTLPGNYLSPVNCGPLAKFLPWMALPGPRAHTQLCLHYSRVQGPLQTWVRRTREESTLPYASYFGRNMDFPLTSILYWPLLYNEDEFDSVSQPKWWISCKDRRQEFKDKIEQCDLLGTLILLLHTITAQCSNKGI